MSVPPSAFGLPSALGSAALRGLAPRPAAAPQPGWGRGILSLLFGSASVLGRSWLSAILPLPQWQVRSKGVSPGCISTPHPEFEGFCLNTPTAMGLHLYPEAPSDA